MVSIVRITTILAVLAVLVVVAGVGLAPRGANAGNTVATCTKAPDLRYDCTKLLVVNDHIQLSANGGICHANVTATGTISATLKSASLSINHGVSNCSWQPGTNVAIGYRIMASPTPSGGPVQVGGIAGLLDPGSDAAAASASSGSGHGVSIALIVGAMLVAIAGAGVVVRMRSKAGAARD